MEKLEPSRLWRNWSVHFCRGRSKRRNRTRKPARKLTLLEARRQDKVMVPSKPVVMCAAALRFPTGPCRRTQFTQLTHDNKADTCPSHV